MKLFLFLLVNLTLFASTYKTKIFNILNEKETKQLKQFSNEQLAFISQLDFDYITQFTLKKEFTNPIQHLAILETEDGNQHSDKIVQLKQASISVDNKNKHLLFRDEYNPSQREDEIICAQIKYKDELKQTGWDKLYIQTNKQCDLGVQMWTAGFLEGYLTSFKIQYFFSNLVKQHEDDNKKYIEKVFRFYKDVEQNIRQKTITLNKIEDQFERLYYSQLSLVQLQTDGMLVGYNQNHFIPMDMSQLYFINGDGQISELINLFKNNWMKKQPELFRMKNKINQKPLDVQELLKKNNVKNLYELYEKSLMKGHCSALMKVIKDSNNVIEDVLFSHQTWDDYSQMLRIFKHYNINGNQMTFSSYPGCLSSTDDWYNNKVQGVRRKDDESAQKVGHIIVTETTLEVLNENLYSYLVDYDHYVPDFMRIVISNRLGYDGKTWTFWMEFINTGTYNSQWMILDIRKARSSKGKTSLDDNTFVMFEQMPGEQNIKFQDMSSYLDQNQYFASYNIPYYPSIRKESGYDDLDVEVGGENYQYNNNPRAILFRDNQEQVTDIQGLKWIMQLNNYSPDPKKRRLKSVKASFEYMSNPGHQIASRFDLLKSNSKNVGAIDAKAVNLELASRNQQWAISGPTHQKQPYFKWSISINRDQHLGQPDQWDFEWELIDPLKMERNKK